MTRTAPATARRLFPLVATLHEVAYSEHMHNEFVPLGARGYWDSYFAGRAAPLGPAPAEVVHAAFYNFAEGPYFHDELPGYSVFYKDEAGDIFHTYSTFSRGTEMMSGVYSFLDVTPKGRNETIGMEWVRHHDRYGSAGAQSCCATETDPVTEMRARLMKAG